MTILTKLLHYLTSSNKSGTDFEFARSHSQCSYTARFFIRQSNKDSGYYIKQTKGTERFWSLGSSQDPLSKVPQQTDDAHGFNVGIAHNFAHFNQTNHHRIDA
jgi:hypothetical protein